VRQSPAGLRAVTLAAVVAGLVLPIILAVRPLSSPDLGYHLRYGETFLDTRKIVDQNDFIYTLPHPASDRYAPGPGCWYDSDGRYRFPNANWGSQVAIAAAWRIAGADGACALQGGLIAAIFALMLLTMRRMGVPWSIAATGLVLAALTGYMRFTLRPEVFGYLLLAGQLYMLSGRRITRLTVTALIVLQLVFVNAHSYFLLGVAMTGAFAGDRLLRVLWWRSRATASADDARRNVSELKLLTVALCGQVGACFANPWTWRLTILPIQALLFMHKNNVGASSLTPGGHPWSYIGEFFRPFAGAFANTKATYAYCLVLLLGALGFISGIVKRRWDRVLIVIGMTGVSLGMRRNIAPGAVVIVPLALSLCHRALTKWWNKLSPRLRAEIPREFAGGVLLIAGWFSINVATQRFYFNERGPIRFGWGLSELHLPVAAAGWIAENPPPERIWCDYTSSSNLHYFAGGVEVPVITNTWAYPPEVMRKVLSSLSGGKAFADAAAEYRLSLVALQAGRSTAALIRELGESADWSLVFLHPRYVVFRRKDESDTREFTTITANTFDVDAFIERAKSLDPVPAYALHLGGSTLYHLGWDLPAARLFAAGVTESPGYHEAWNMQGVCLARLGGRLLRQTGDKEMLIRAVECFRRALDLNGGYQPARINLELATNQLRSPRKPVVYAPQ